MQGPKKFNAQTVRFWVSEIKSSEDRKIDEMQKRNNYPDIIKFYEGEPFAIDNTNLNTTKAKLAYVQDYFPNTNQLHIFCRLYQQKYPWDCPDQKCLMELIVQAL